MEEATAHTTFNLTSAKNKTQKPPELQMEPSAALQLNFRVAELAKSFGRSRESPKVLATFATARILIPSCNAALVLRPPLVFRFSVCHWLCHCSGCDCSDTGSARGTRRLNPDRGLESKGESPSGVCYSRRSSWAGFQVATSSSDLRRRSGTTASAAGYPMGNKTKGFS